MKRWMSVLLAALMFVSALPIGVSADGSVAVPHIYGVVDKTDVERGDTFTLSVMMENNPGLVGWMVQVDFNESAFELIEQNKGDAFSVGSFSFGKLTEQSPANALWYDFLYGDNASVGALFTLTFRVKDTAVNGSEILAIYCDDSTNIINADGDEVAFIFDNAAVTVYGCTHEYDNACDGDCNLCGETREAGDHVYEEQIWLYPTCAEDGLMRYVCVNCGHYREEIIPATGEHTYHNDCDTDCDVCGTTRTPADHVYDNPCDALCNICDEWRWVEGHVYDNDCDGDCNLCGEGRTPADHVYEAVKMIDPTCGAAGLAWYVCVSCGDAYDEVVPATGKHTYDTICDPTCNGCDYVREVEPHYYTDTVTVPATCGNGGIRTYTCVGCGHSYDEAIPATGEHVYDSDHDPDCNVCGAPQDMSDHVYTATVTIPATCGGVGVMTYTCVGCNHSYTEIIPATGNHTYDNACDAACNGCGVTRVPAAHVYDNPCDADCNVCGGVRTPAAHVYDNACDADCNVCGAVREVGDHVYSASVVTPATCGAAGVMAYGCVHCGYRYVAAIPATGDHLYDNACDADCNRCGGVREVGDHLFDNDCDPDCNECGATRATAHVYRNPAAPVCALCGTAFVAGNVPVVYGAADNALLTRGDTFTLAVMMENNPGLMAWLIDVAYDEAVLELVNQTKGNAFPGGVSFGPLRSPANGLWTDFLSGKNYTNNGTLFTFTFVVKEDAVFGTTVLQLYCRDTDNIVNTDWDVVTFAFESTAVVVQDHTHVYDNNCDGDCNICGFTRVPADHVYDNACDGECNECGATREVGDHWYDHDCDVDCNVCGAVRVPYDHEYDHDFDAECNHCGVWREIPGVYGDLSGDGRVNVRDFALLQRYLNGWDIDVTLECMDVNGDGKINVRDLGLLQQYLNGWNVEFGKK